MKRRSFLHASSLAAAGAVLRPLARGRRRARARAGPSNIVETTSGRVRGLFFQGVNTFRGIPYGASTAGANRFMPPRKPQPWTGVRDVNAIGLRAPQLDEPARAGVVRLRPQRAAGRRLPGAERLHAVARRWPQAAGDGVAARRRLRRRIGRLHGLRRAEPGGDARRRARAPQSPAQRVRLPLSRRRSAARRYADGNAGMLDIVAALEWVRDNIANFGGDPDNVTVFGQSGGGSKVSTLLGMPAAKGLFHKAIAMSGSQVRSLTREQASATTDRVLAALGVDQDRLDDLHTLPMRRLREVLNGGGAQGFAFGPGGGRPHAARAPVRSRGQPARRRGAAADRIDRDRSHVERVADLRSAHRRGAARGRHARRCAPTPPAPIGSIAAYRATAAEGEQPRSLSDHRHRRARTSAPAPTRKPIARRRSEARRCSSTTSSGTRRCAAAPCARCTRWTSRSCSRTTSWRRR